MERGVQLSDILIGATIAGAATIGRESGVAPEWVSHAIAAVTGSATGAGFRFLAGHFENWGRGAAAFAVGVVGAYFGAMLVVGFFGLEHSLEVPLTFFMGTFIAGVLKTLATGVDPQSVIDRYLDKKLGTRSDGNRRNFD